MGFAFGTAFTMQLSDQAKKELRRILKKELGDLVEQFSDRDIELLGIRLLGMTSTVLKRKSKKVISGSI